MVVVVGGARLAFPSQTMSPGTSTTRDPLGICSGSVCEGPARRIEACWDGPVLGGGFHRTWGGRCGDGTQGRCQGGGWWHTIGTLKIRGVGRQTCDGDNALGVGVYPELLPREVRIASGQVLGHAAMAGGEHRLLAEHLGCPSCR